MSRSQLSDQIKDTSDALLNMILLQFSRFLTRAHNVVVYRIEESPPKDTQKCTTTERHT